jgi:hypothetical protein
VPGRSPRPVFTYSVAPDEPRGSWFWCAWRRLVGLTPPSGPADCHGWVASEGEARAAALAACPEGHEAHEEPFAAPKLLRSKRYSADGKRARRRDQEGIKAAVERAIPTLATTPRGSDAEREVLASIQLEVERHRRVLRQRLEAESLARRARRELEQRRAK